MGGGATGATVSDGTAVAALVAGAGIPAAPDSTPADHAAADRAVAQARSERAAQRAVSVPEICLLVEGTYPYVAGGVSSWVHDIIRGQPERSFSVLNIGPHPGAYGEPRYALPENVVELHKLFCHDGRPAPLNGRDRSRLDNEIRMIRRRSHRSPQRHATRSSGGGSGSRVLEGLRRLFLDDTTDDALIADLAAADLDVASFLHGQAGFDFLAEVSEKRAPDTSFLDLFWHFRAMNVPLLRLLAAPAPPARCYHAVSTGYAGILAAVWSHRTGRPMLLTEHGIYSRERDMEIARADWIRDAQDDDDVSMWMPQLSPLRRLWSLFFRRMAQVAYHQSRSIITLSDVNREKQIADGAPTEKVSIVPNGVDVADETAAPSLRESAEGDSKIIPLPDRPRAIRVGFVGRVVPIKDVITFIKACDLALREIPLDVRIIGPIDEDPAYAARCKALVRTLGREDSIRFLGPQPPSKIYGDLDVVVLTSFSEGQPLVMLEAYAASVPVIATDVGACREMIEGRQGEDRALGPSGVVTRVAVPEDTAAALVRLARDPRMRRRFGSSGRKRVATFYRRAAVLDAYRTLYTELVA